MPSTPVLAFNRGPVAKLLKALGIPSSACNATLSVQAGQLVTLTVTRKITGEELEGLADAFETEGLTFAHSETVYLLEEKDPASGPVATIPASEN